LRTLHFEHQARHEVRQIKLGDIALIKDEGSGEEYLEWTPRNRERVRPTMTMKMNTKNPAYETGDRKCPVSCFKEFTGDQKKPNLRKVHSSLLSVAGEYADKICS